MDFEMELSSGGVSSYEKAFKTFPPHSQPDQSLVGENNDDVLMCVTKMFILLFRTLRETSKFSHKSLSCMSGDSAGLINHEVGIVFLIIIDDHGLINNKVIFMFRMIINNHGLINPQS